VNKCQLTQQLDIFETTQSGRASYGVVPFENSTNGSVVFTLDHFADREGQYPDLCVCAEVYLDVHHCLLGHFQDLPSSSSSSPWPGGALPQIQEAGSTNSPTLSGQSTPTPAHPTPQPPRTRPLGSLSHIQRIYSHPQAFGQCARFLHAFLKGVETVDVSSTSRAAEMVKNDSSGASAAISSAIAAEMHGLDVLGRNIEDREDNTTRFFVLRKGTDHGEGEGEAFPVPRRGGPIHDHEGQGDDTAHPWTRTKSLVSFRVPHTSPGALAAVLEVFRANGLNLTSINSRPSLAEPFRYIFFVEFEGHRFQDPDGRVKRTLEGIEAVAESSRWLGSWDNMR
jgi:prephenate dehydratase